MSKVGEHYREREEMGLPKEPRPTILCDGDCGNYYEEKFMSATCYGQNMCKECMFAFMAGQEYMYRRDEGSDQ